MNDNSTSTAFPPEVMSELQANYVRISAPVSAQLLWDSVLTPSDRVALGNDFRQAFAQGGTLGMWQRLRGVSNVRAVIDAARELNLIDDLAQRRLLSMTGEFSEDHEEALQLAIRNADLVLTDRPRTAYWRGQFIPIEWDRQSALWNFFWELCCHAKSRRAVDRTAFSDDFAPSYLAKIKSRLGRAQGFPLDLADLIEPAGGNTQRLRLAPERIRILKTDAREICREELGR